MEWIKDIDSIITKFQDLENIIKNSKDLSESTARIVIEEGTIGQICAIRNEFKSGDYLIDAIFKEIIDKCRGIHKECDTSVIRYGGDSCWRTYLRRMYGTHQQFVDIRVGKKQYDEYKLIANFVKILEWMKYPDPNEVPLNTSNPNVIAYLERLKSQKLLEQIDKRFNTFIDITNAKFAKLEQQLAEEKQKNEELRKQLIANGSLRVFPEYNYEEIKQRNKALHKELLRMQKIFIRGIRYQQVPVAIAIPDCKTFEVSNSSQSEWVFPNRI